jgi:hypothetical protein
MSYYSSAMERIRRMVRQPRFFVFSDDLDWVREHFVAPDTVVVDANGPEAADQELRLMSACRHHIMANSSSSWWAVWLGEDEIADCDRAGALVYHGASDAGSVAGSVAVAAARLIDDTVAGTQARHCYSLFSRRSGPCVHLSSARS